MTKTYYIFILPIHSYVGLILDHRLRRWPRIKPTLGRCILLAGTGVVTLWTAMIVNLQSPTINNFYFHSLEVVDRVSDPQLQVSEIIQISNLVDCRHVLSSTCLKDGI